MRRGVTAVELMLAACVLAVALVPLLSAGAGVARQSGFTAGHAIAVVQARSLLDRALALGFTELERRASAGESLARADAPPAPGGLVLEAEPVTFERVGPALARLEARVSWRQSARAPAHRVRIARLVARPDHGWSHRIESAASFDPAVTD